MTFSRLVKYFPALGLLFLANALCAAELNLPGNPVMTREKVTTAGSYFLPLGPFNNDELPLLEIEGHIVQQAWRVEAQALTTLQMLTPLREQVVQMGYEVLFDCQAQECGGFDFRFNTSVLSAPDMFVDLANYRFLSAKRSTEDGSGDGPADYLSILVSQSGPKGYTQIIQVIPDGASHGVLAVTPEQDVTNVESVTRIEVPDGSVAEQLLTTGHTILQDLLFDSGSSNLGAGPFDALADLAAFMLSDNSRRIALVGHTDSVGTLEGNVALSQRRAASVLERLVERYNVPRERLEAGGMGYLSPVTSNATSEGRGINRRVEAVLLNTE